MSVGIETKSAEYLHECVHNSLNENGSWPAAMSIIKITQTANAIMQLLKDYSDIPARKSIRSVHPLATTPQVSGSSTRLIAEGQQEQLFKSAN